MLEDVFALVVCVFWIGTFIFEKEKMPFALYMYVALCPYNAVLSSQYSLLDKTIEIMLLITCVHLLIMKRMVLKVNKWFLYFVASVFFSGLMAILRENDINIFISTELRYFTGILLVVILGINVIDTQEKINTIFKLFAGNSFFLAIGCWVENLKNIKAWYYFFNERKGFMLGINHLAIYMAIGIISFVYILYQKYCRNGLKRSDYVIVFIYGIICGSICVLTKSSAILMGVICVVGLYVGFVIGIYENIKLLNILMLVFVATLLGVSLYVASGGYNESSVLQKMVSLLGRGSNVDGSRLTIWGEALRQFKSCYVVGIGPNMFHAEYNGVMYISHNDYLKVLSELGVIGIIAFLGFIIDVLNDIIRYSDKTSCLFWMSIFLMLLTFMLTHNYIMYATFWIICMMQQAQKNISLGEKMYEKVG